MSRSTRVSHLSVRLSLKQGKVTSPLWAETTLASQVRSRNRRRPLVRSQNTAPSEGAASSSTPSAGLATQGNTQAPPTQSTNSAQAIDEEAYKRFKTHARSSEKFFQQNPNDNEEVLRFERLAFGLKKDRKYLYIVHDYRDEENNNHPHHLKHETHLLLDKADWKARRKTWQRECLGKGLQVIRSTEEKHIVLRNKSASVAESIEAFDGVDSASKTDSIVSEVSSASNQSMSLLLQQGLESRPSPSKGKDERGPHDTPMLPHERARNIPTQSYSLAESTDKDGDIKLSRRITEEPLATHGAEAKAPVDERKALEGATSTISDASRVQQGLESRPSPSKGKDERGPHDTPMLPQKRARNIPTQSYSLAESTDKDGDIKLSRRITEEPLATHGAEAKAPVDERKALEGATSTISDASRVQQGLESRPSPSKGKDERGPHDTPMLPQKRARNIPTQSYSLAESTDKDGDIKLSRRITEEPLATHGAEAKAPVDERKALEGATSTISDASRVQQGLESRPSPSKGKDERVPHDTPMLPQKRARKIPTQSYSLAEEDEDTLLTPQTSESKGEAHGARVKSLPDGEPTTSFNPLKPSISGTFSTSNVENDDGTEPTVQVEASPNQFRVGSSSGAEGAGLGSEQFHHDEEGAEASSEGNRAEPSFESRFEPSSESESRDVGVGPHRPSSTSSEEDSERALTEPSAILEGEIKPVVSLDFPVTGVSEAPTRALPPGEGRIAVQRPSEAEEGFLPASEGDSSEDEAETVGTHRSHFRASVDEEVSLEGATSAVSDVSSVVRDGQSSSPSSSKASSSRNHHSSLPSSENDTLDDDMLEDLREAVASINLVQAWLEANRELRDKEAAEADSRDVGVEPHLSSSSSSSTEPTYGRTEEPDATRSSEGSGLGNRTEAYRARSEGNEGSTSAPEAIEGVTTSDAAVQYTDTTGYRTDSNSEDISENRTPTADNRPLGGNLEKGLHDLDYRELCLGLTHFELSSSNTPKNLEETRKTKLQIVNYQIPEADASNGTKAKIREILGRIAELLDERIELLEILEPFIKEAVEEEALVFLRSLEEPVLKNLVTTLGRVQQQIRPIIELCFEAKRAFLAHSREVLNNNPLYAEDVEGLLGESLKRSGVTAFYQLPYYTYEPILRSAMVSLLFSAEEDAVLSAITPTDNIWQILSKKREINLNRGRYKQLRETDLGTLNRT